MTSSTLHAGSGEADRVFYRDHERTEVTLELPHSGNATLKQVLIFAGLSKATAYKWGLVPEYDDNGRLIETGKVPPFPWMRMPHSLIRNRKGKKLFLVEEIRAWRQAVRDRSREIDAIAKAAILSMPTVDRRFGNRQFVHTKNWYGARKLKICRQRPTRCVGDDLQRG